MAIPQEPKKDTALDLQTLLNGGLSDFKNEDGTIDPEKFNMDAVVKLLEGMFPGAKEILDMFGGLGALAGKGAKAADAEPAQGTQPEQPAPPEPEGQMYTYNAFTGEFTPEGLTFDPENFTILGSGGTTMTDQFGSVAMNMDSLDGQPFSFHTDDEINQMFASADGAAADDYNADPSKPGLSDIKIGMAS